VLALHVHDTLSPAVFQSLFSWMFRSKDGCGQGIRHRCRVSILVLVDVSFEVYQPRADYGVLPVSILVLVDVSFEDTEYTGDKLYHTGFNPCSRGCFVRRLPVLYRLWGLVGFNPCSRGCFVRRRRIVADGEADYQFQSLFSWMFRSKRVCGDLNEHKEGVSILVLVDVSFEGAGVTHHGTTFYVSILVLVDVSFEAASLIEMSDWDAFQSLFSWMFRSKYQTLFLADILICFNPCSRGCFVRSLQVYTLPTVTNEFQSLFSWMFRSKRRQSDLVYRPTAFQSLFSWMFRSKMKVPVVPRPAGGFNPCSRGCFVRREYGFAFVANNKFQSLFSWMFRSKAS